MTSDFVNPVATLGAAVEVDRIGPLPGFMTGGSPDDVTWVTMPSGAGMWLVTDYRLARQVLTDRRFSRAAAAAPDAPKANNVEPHPQALMSLDGAEHARVRRIVAGAFTARRIAGMEPLIRDLTGRLLDEAEQAGPPFELIAGLAGRLPLTVLCTLLGIPRADRELFGEWVDVVFDIDASSEQEKRSRRLRLVAYMSRLIKSRREQLGDDLLSTLISARDDEERLSGSELVHLALTLLMAGYETTIGQISLMVMELLVDPGQFATVRSRPELRAAAVEELLRINPATPMTFPRVAVEDVELGGVPISAGQGVVVSVLDANRDVKVFPVSGSAAMVGQTATHFTFGHGVHRCLGAPLARLQLTVVLDELVTRFPTLRMADDTEPLMWTEGMSVRSLRSLRVSW